MLLTLEQLEQSVFGDVFAGLYVHLSFSTLKGSATICPWPLTSTPAMVAVRAHSTIPRPMRSLTSQAVQRLRLTANHSISSVDHFA